MSSITCAMYVIVDFAQSVINHVSPGAFLSLNPLSPRAFHFFGNVSVLHIIWLEFVVYPNVHIIRFSGLIGINYFSSGRFYTLHDKAIFFLPFGTVLLIFYYINEKKQNI